MRDIKVGDVLLSVDGKEPESLREALDVSVIGCARCGRGGHLQMKTERCTNELF